MQVFEAGEAGPLCFITSAYCDGPTLAEWLVRHGRADDCHEAAALVADLADAVEFVHRAEMLHRDIKPANILLDPRAGHADDHSLSRYIPKLTDFGLVRLVGSEASRTRHGARLGTPSYMAPEQARGDRAAIGRPSDVYGLGAVLFELLTGHRPFESDNEAETLRQVLADEPANVRRLRPDVPADLAAIVRKCLEKEPSARYATAADLTDDLRRFLRGDATRARPLSGVQRLALGRRKSCPGRVGNGGRAVAGERGRFVDGGGRAH